MYVSFPPSQIVLCVCLCALSACVPPALRHLGPSLSTAVVALLLRGPLARHMNLMDLQRAAEQGRRGKMGTFPAGRVANMRLDEALEWAAGALAKIQVCLPAALLQCVVLFYFACSC